MQDMLTTLKKGDLIRFINIYSNGEMGEMLYIYLSHYQDSFGMNYMRLMNVKKSCMQEHRLASPLGPTGYWKKVN